jgi:hypothetical protein
MDQPLNLQAPPGKYRIIGVDRFEEVHGSGQWVVGDYDDRDAALALARQQTRENLALASSPEIATFFYVYDDNGRYLGGGDVGATPP